MANDAMVSTGWMGSINRTVSKAVWYMRFLGWILICALGLRFASDYIDLPQDFDQQIDRAVVAGGFIVLLFGSVYREVTRIRKEKYANIQQEMHAIIHAVRDSVSYLQEASFDEMSIAELKASFTMSERQIYYVLDKFSAIFSMLTGTYCRTSIKQISESLSTGEFIIYTLARDNESARENEKTDKDRLEKESDRLFENEDFSLLFDEEKRWFFANNLPRRATYQNSKDPRINTGDKNNMNNWIDFCFPGKRWTLPYMSTIVWPIQQRGSKDLPIERQEGCIAFLTVDSQHRGVFNERFDTFLGAAVADALFHLLILFNELNTALASKEAGQAE